MKNEEAAPREAKAIIWLFIWLIISPFVVFHGNIGIPGVGTDLSAAIIGMPLIVAGTTVFSIIGHSTDFKSYSIAHQTIYILFFVYLFLLIFKQTRMFLLRLFDYPNIEALLWGALSVFFAVGPFFLNTVNYYIGSFIEFMIFFPGKISYIIVKNMGKFTGLINSTNDYVNFTLDFFLNALSIAIAYLILKKGMPFMRQQIKTRLHNRMELG